MSLSDERPEPAVAIILYGLNVEAFVEITARSLLAQDYPHLEFYFSDDGSTDRTFDILQKVATDAQRPVILARNQTNRGICNQVNAGVAKTTAPLVMLANADDIYPPGYVSRLVAAWRNASPRPTVLWAELSQIDESGAPRGRIMQQLPPGETLDERVRHRCAGPGATGALYDRRVFEEFGPLPDDLILEDAPLNLRALVLGPELRIAEPWVQYRVHGANTSQAYFTKEGFDQWVQRRNKRATWNMVQGHRAYVEMLRDLHQRPANQLDPVALKRARQVAIEKIFETALLADYYAQDRTIGDGARWMTLWRLAKLLVKLTLKRWIPALETRSLRWEYRQQITND